MPASTSSSAVCAEQARGGACRTMRHLHQGLGSGSWDSWAPRVTAVPTLRRRHWPQLPCHNLLREPCQAVRPGPISLTGGGEMRHPPSSSLVLWSPLRVPMWNTTDTSCSRCFRRTPVGGCSGWSWRVWGHLAAGVEHHLSLTHCFKTKKMLGPDYFTVELYHLKINTSPLKHFQ